MKRDILNLKPDMLSILIGINDVWHELEWHNGVDTKKFKKIYRMLLEEIQEALPDTKILLMEPFVLKGSATSAKIDQFVAETAAKAEAVRELAAELHLPFLPLQEDLNKLATRMPEDYWLLDGVHPAATFHQHIADKWICAFKEML
jgi:lysophospholipase L1-like esterase